MRPLNFIWYKFGLALHHIVNPVLMGLMMMGSLAIVVANIVADLTYALLDPRIRYD